MNGRTATSVTNAPASAEWLCPARSCRYQLGLLVADGALRLYVPAREADRSGTLTVPCPRCGREKRWYPKPGRFVVS